MRKELRPVHDLVSCDLCQRTILKGERIETFVGGGDRQKVCELCSLRALRSGWTREADLPTQAPDRDRQQPRRSLWSRALTWAEDQGIWGSPPSEGDEAPGPSATPEPQYRAESAPAEPAAPARAAASEAPPEPAPAQDPLEERRRRAEARAEERRLARRMRAQEAEEADEEAPEEDAAAMARRPARGAPPAAGLRDLISGRRREPRRVQAVPSGRWAKIELALEMFNNSEHRRTMAGVGRTLGEPWVSAAPLVEGPEAREVGIVIAWEISWYRFRIDLDDNEPAVVLFDRGNELEDLGEQPHEWNVGADAEGRLAVAVEAVS